jgi:glycosyltransferase involved in cell wall biosynthesis
MNPKISIIVATYNSERTLEKCLNSLMKNMEYFSNEEIEVLVADYNSKDSTIDILKKFPICKLLPMFESGISRAHNLGVEKAQGDYGIFLNSDDELGPNFLRVMLDIAISKKSDRHVVYSTVEFIDFNSNSLYLRHPAPYIGFIQEKYSIILHPNAIYPMNLLKINHFEVLPGNPPTDREQVYNLMKNAVWSRTREVHYRFRIWSSSETVRRSAYLSKTKSNNIYNLIAINNNNNNNNKN